MGQAEDPGKVEEQAVAALEIDVEPFARRTRPLTVEAEGTCIDYCIPWGCAGAKPA